jgi:penicillin-binding protein 1A
VIWEAFKPESEPRRINRAEDSFGPARGGRIRSDAQFLEESGGIY